MSVVPPGSIALVTGANGFISMWLIHLLLEKGYRVRGTVRSEDKIAHIKKTFEKYGDKVEIIVVKDIVEVSFITWLILVRSAKLMNVIFLILAWCFR